MVNLGVILGFFFFYFFVVYNVFKEEDEVDLVDGDVFGEMIVFLVIDFIFFIFLNILIILFCCIFLLLILVGWVLFVYVKVCLLFIGLGVIGCWVSSVDCRKKECFFLDCIFWLY